MVDCEICNDISIVKQCLNPWIAKLVCKPREYNK